MTFCSYKNLGLAVCLGFAAVAAQTQAATVTYGPFSHGPAITNWNVNLPITQFDPSIGTLTGIEFTLSSTISGQLDFVNTTAGTLNATGSVDATATLTNPVDLTSLVQVFPTTPVNHNAPVGVSSVVLPTFSAGPTTSVLYTSPAILAAYLGLGTTNTPASIAGSANVTLPSGLFVGPDLEGYAEVSVTYYYTAIPEPASLGLAAMGSMLMLVRRRR